MKWKSGMKVRCIKTYAGFNFGDVFELTKRFDNNGWDTSPSLWCYIRDDRKKYWEVVDMFTKDDLEVGMLVEMREMGFRDTRLYIVMNSKQGMCFNDEFGEWMALYHYDDDLKRSNGNTKDDFDIMKVYDIKGINYKANLLSTDDRELLWERKETLELTLDEIADKYGVDVNNLKIKK